MTKKMIVLIIIYLLITTVVFILFKEDGFLIAFPLPFIWISAKALYFRIFRNKKIYFYTQSIPDNIQETWPFQALITSANLMVLTSLLWILLNALTHATLR